MLESQPPWFDLVDRIQMINGVLRLYLESCPPPIFRRRASRALRAGAARPRRAVFVLASVRASVFAC